MQFSVSIEYAIHGLIYLARAGDEKTVLLADIASSIKVPKEYMRKIFQMLTRSGLITGRRGAGGGTAWRARPASSPCGRSWRRSKAPCPCTAACTCAGIASSP